MSTPQFIERLGEPISDPSEESFLLFTTPIPTSNLGFLDSKSTSLEVSMHGQDLQVEQSPGLLNANLPGGTTGAVVWKITPVIAEWVSDQANVLFKHDMLSWDSVVLELGAGVSGIVALALADRVRKYVATDQEYVLKILKSNIAANSTTETQKGKKANSGAIEVLALDWETSDVSELSSLIPELQSSGSGPGGLDAIIACDCIYNEALILPFVETCASLCRLRSKTGQEDRRPTTCIIAQQLRSDIVFEEWLRVFMQHFQVWRMPDGFLSPQLQEGNGFVVHIGILR